MKNLSYILLLSVSTNIFGIEASPKGKITGYFTGWGGDAVRVQIEGATYTEGNCLTKDGYITAESDNSGYKTHASALLAAYMSGKPVTIIVDGCIINRPRIIGVSIN